MMKKDAFWKRNLGKILVVLIIIGAVVALYFLL